MEDRRSKATPMDFQYENMTGPTDATSPFMTLGRSGMKRTHSAFNSPSKAQPFGLREPNGSSFLFSSTSGRDKPLPANPPRSFDPKFNTPRKMEVDFSSGGETPDTEINSEANTPDVIRKKSTASPTKAPSSPSKSSPSKDRRNSFFGKMGRMFNSPGRGEIAKREYYSAKSERRVQRRRAKELKEIARRNSTEEDDEDDSSNNKSKKNNTTSPKGSVIAAVLSFVHEHPNLPHILSWYLQFLFNGFLGFIAAYIVWSFVAAIMGDVDMAAKKVTAETMREMAVCAKQYQENRCDPATRAPALENVCNNWDKCMNQDPTAVGKASVSAHTFAMIFNSLIEPISYKAMFFSLAILSSFFYMSNTAFGFFRNKTAEQFQHLHQQQQHYMQPPPATPQRQYSGQFYTPYQQGSIRMGHEPMPSLPPGAGASEEQRQIGW
ncbi:hypothetical protein EJ05DRAFT_497852 [Pseudovirgaria hyperparasitica]|uniref:Brl1/Brr6 domain-containing protein n=1 Tax=Pseudovirgaria hyperparasitica TaxID=470096 RepID=A0A6A6WGX1_9PEZI|nr:uncharacterized protein EJ05DRAFT_497852 [Pseudovirgaria hyperparasitica]KAF2761300.1 hypothetical protein EJ05DRAFT_497852 [Pseudovirgaria hyperparasitica]